MLGILSTLSGIAGAYVLACAASLSVATGLGCAYWKGKTSYITQMAIDELDKDTPYNIHFANQSELRRSCEMTAPYYKSEYVEFDVAEKWREANDKAFVAITNKDGEICSCFGLLGLERSCFDEFIRGRIADREFTNNDVLTLADSKKQDRLYLSGVIVNNPKTYYGGKRTVVMTWAILRYYKKYFGNKKKRKIYVARPHTAWRAALTARPARRRIGAPELAIKRRPPLARR